MVVNNSETLNAVADFLGPLRYAIRAIDWLTPFLFLHSKNVWNLFFTTPCQFSFILFLVNMAKISIYADVAVEDHGGFVQLKGNKRQYIR